MAIELTYSCVSDVMKADGWWLALMGYVLRGLIDSLAGMMKAVGLKRCNEIKVNLLTRL